MDFKHEIIGLKDQGDKNDVDENVSDHGMYFYFTEISRWVGEGVTLKSTYYGWWEVIAPGPLLLM